MLAWSPQGGISALIIVGSTDAESLPSNAGRHNRREIEQDFSTRDSVSPDIRFHAA